jgi:hypothetical protein
MTDNPGVPRRALALLTLLLALAAALPAVSAAAEPPDQDDPCSTSGRNTCGTNGAGRYDTYRYGIRWFGDYRRAIPDVKTPAFCIDLRFWYPSPAFDYEQRDPTGLKNRDGDAVGATALRRMSYALWRFGRSNDPERQGAVMLYVHRLMGDGAPGEVDPTAVGLAAAYRQVERDAARFAGPYKVVTGLSDRKLVSGDRTRLTARLVAASGAAVPGVALKLAVTGAKAPATVRTGADGVARVDLRATSAAADLKVDVTSEAVPATEPALYVPTKGRAARSGQRLVTAASTTVRSQERAAVEPAQAEVATKAEPETVLPGEAVRDAVTITGVPEGWSADVEVRLFGPARRREDLRCDGAPAATATYRAKGGLTKTPDLKLTAVGWYGFQLVVPDSGEVRGVTTPCVPAEETLRVQAQPAIRTQVSAPAVDPGANVHDDVVVTGLAGETAPVEAELWGPYPSREAMTCQGAPAWKGTFTATGDGTYETDPVTLQTPGFYTYRERIAATELVRAVETPCGEALETTIVRGAPQIRTQISSADTKPGDEVTDLAVVSGLGVLEAEVGVELWGPYPTREAMTCEGEPFWRGTFPAKGDGEYRTAPVKLTKAGFYTYREAILPSETQAGTRTACGEATETTLTKAAPAITTQVSKALVRPGEKLFDRLQVSGLGQSQVEVEVALYGPYATRSAIDCEGQPYARTTVTVGGDGAARSAETEVRRAGFYTYVTRVAGAPTVAAFESACGEPTETAFAIPTIPTGRAAGTARAAAASSPTRVGIARLGIDAPIRSVGLDLTRGELDVPDPIREVGAWRDGAKPGGPAGTILLAGHVDAKDEGAGAFYALRRARRGDVVRLAPQDGTVRRFRVRSVATMPKDRLPTRVFAGESGPRRLVLVTCGGPFDAARGHYRDNVVVTAEPVR